MDNKQAINEVMQSIKAGTSSDVKKQIEALLYQSAGNRIKEMRTEIAKSFFNKIK